MGAHSTRATSSATATPPRGRASTPTCPASAGPVPPPAPPVPASLRCSSRPSSRPAACLLRNGSVTVPFGSSLMPSPLSAGAGGTHGHLRALPRLHRVSYQVVLPGQRVSYHGTGHACSATAGALPGSARKPAVGQWEHDLRPMPGAPPYGVPRRYLVRLPAPAAAPASRAGARLAPPGLTQPSRAALPSRTSRPPAPRGNSLPARIVAR